MLAACGLWLVAISRSQLKALTSRLCRNDAHFFHQEGGVHFLRQPGFQLVIERELILLDEILKGTNSSDGIIRICMNLNTCLTET